MFSSLSYIIMKYMYIPIVCYAPLNGQVDCGSGLMNMGLKGDNCSFSCDPGYMLQGSVTSGTCEDNGNWSEGLPFSGSGSGGLPFSGSGSGGLPFSGSGSGGLPFSGSGSGGLPFSESGSGGLPFSESESGGLPFSESGSGGLPFSESGSGGLPFSENWIIGSPSCVPVNCSADNLTVPANAIVLQLPPCSPAYQSQCTVSCDEGFTGDDVTYLCNVTSDPTMVDWMVVNGTAMDPICQRGLLLHFISDN